jgi:hypothetical protein
MALRSSPNFLTRLPREQGHCPTRDRQFKSSQQQPTANSQLRSFVSVGT